MKKLKKKPPKQKSLMDYAMGRLAKSGVVFFDGNVDAEYLELPRDITDVADKELGKYLHTFTQQKNYLRTLVAIATVELMEVQNKYEEEYGRAYNASPSSTVNDKKEYARSSAKVREQQEAIDRANAVLTLASANLEALSDSIFSLSSEITRREKSNAQDNREYNVQNKKRR